MGAPLQTTPVRRALWLLLLATACGPGADGLESINLSANGAEYPGAIWMSGVNHFRRGRGGAEIRHIIIHIADGTTPKDLSEDAGTPNWFRDPSSRVSSHYLVTEDGRVLQFVREEDTAWHAAGHNSDTIGIEHEGFPDGKACGCPGGAITCTECPPNVKNWYTDAMYRASADLVAYLATKYQIVPSPSTIFGHKEIATNGKSCPGPFFETQQGQSYRGVVLAAMQSAPASTQPEPAPQDNTMIASNTWSPATTTTPTPTVTQPSPIPSPAPNTQTPAPSTQTPAADTTIPASNGTSLASNSTDPTTSTDPDGSAAAARCPGEGVLCPIPGLSNAGQCGWGQWTCSPGGGGYCRQTKFKCQRSEPSGQQPNAQTDQQQTAAQSQTEPEDNSAEQLCAAEGVTCYAGGLGLCAVGKTTCIGGELFCPPSPPQGESCDGLDNDCNDIDDDVPGGCSNASVPTAVPEVCNGLDDDLDGFPDQGNPGGGATCAIASGAAAGTQGTLVCAYGQLECLPLQVPQAPHAAQVYAELTEDGSNRLFDCAVGPHPTAPPKAWILLLLAILCRRTRRRAH